MKKKAPASPISSELQQLWGVFCSNLMKTELGQTLYTQGVIGLSLVPPTKGSHLSKMCN